MLSEAKCHLVGLRHAWMTDNYGCQDYRGNLHLDVVREYESKLQFYADQSAYCRPTMAHDTLPRNIVNTTKLADCHSNGDFPTGDSCTRDPMHSPYYAHRLLVLDQDNCSSTPESPNPSNMANGAGYDASSPCYSPTSPGYSPTNPNLEPERQGFEDVSSPSYAPVSPGYSPTTPSYEPGTPDFDDVSSQSYSPGNSGDEHTIPNFEL